MRYFEQLPGELVRVRYQYSFIQCDLYVLGNELFFKRGGSYVRMMWGHQTSHPKLRWEEHSIDPSKVQKDAMGKLIYAGE